MSGDWIRHIEYARRHRSSNLQSPCGHLADKRLTVAHPDSEHDIPDAQRKTAYRLLDSVLKP